MKNYDELMNDPETMTEHYVKGVYERWGVKDENAGKSIILYDKNYNTRANPNFYIIQRTNTRNN